MDGHFIDLTPENLAKEQAPSMQQELLDKHFLRKHGANAYYGQK